MQITPVNPPEIPVGNAFAQGVLVTGAERLLFISGQVPSYDRDALPSDFESQCRMAWRNVVSVLENAALTVLNLVKVTVFLSDREYRAANSEIRQEFLGEHSPALTIIITDIYSEDWLLEIEAVAAA